MYLPRERLPRSTGALLGSIVIAIWAGSCSDSGANHGRATGDFRPDQARGHAIVEAMVRPFERAQQGRGAGSTRSGGAGGDGSSSPLLQPAVTVRAGQGVVRWRAGEDGQPAVRFELPVAASRPRRIALDHGDFWVAHSLRGARDVVGELAEGFLVYPEASVGGAHVVALPFAAGMEDLFSFTAPPEAPEVCYDVTMGSAVAGLRLVANSLEFLDLAGTPRLRVAPPYIVSADGDVRGASLGVDGCRFDTNPAPPWGRPVTAPGVNSCGLCVRWDDENLLYPAVLDPAWSLTGAMVLNRYGHEAVRLSTGRVLAVGGRDLSAAASTSAELYDPGTGTWASTGNLTVERRDGFSATVLESGDVLVVGGGPSATTAELYSAADGLWTAAAAPASDRGFSRHEAVRLGTGDVLVVSGSQSTNYTPPPVADYYVPDLDAWFAVSGPSRFEYSLVRLQDGRVLLVGGRTWTGRGGNASSSAQLYDHSSKTWSEVGPMTNARAMQSAAVLPSGKVLVVGGHDAGRTPLNTAELFDPVDQSWTALPPMSHARRNPRAVTVGDDVLVVGGTTATAATELFDGAQQTWSGGGGMSQPRDDATATRLASGGVLVAGGGASGYVDVFDPEDRHPQCGNGIVDPPEACDGTVLGGATCRSLGFAGGVLSCTSACTLDTDRCAGSVATDGGVEPGCGNFVCEAGEGCSDCPDDCGDCCGNETIDDGEMCDGDNLGEATCRDLNFARGELACRGSCTSFDASGCVPYPACGDGQCDSTESCVSCSSDCGACCGNERVDVGEVCDGLELGGATCRDQGFASGELLCQPSCRAFDTSACVAVARCGDGACDADETCRSCSADCGDCCGNETLDFFEECDGDLGLGGATCQAMGYSLGGEMPCTNSCHFDTSRCCESIVPLGSGFALAGEIEIPELTFGSSDGSFAVSLEGAARAGEVDSADDRCRVGISGGVDLEFCITQNDAPRCGDLEIESERVCEAPALCVEAPEATCDTRGRCCREHLRGSPSFALDLDLVDEEWSIKKMGVYVGANIDIGARIELSGGVDTGAISGAGCDQLEEFERPCPRGTEYYQYYKVMFQGQVTGQATVGANAELPSINLPFGEPIRLGGWDVNFLDARASGCARFDIDQFFCDGDYNPRLHGGIVAGASLSADWMGYFGLEPFDVELLREPAGFAGCAGEGD